MAALVHEHFDHFFFAVNVIIGTVAVIGQAFHAAVIEVTGTKAHDAEVDATLLVALHHFYQFFGRGNAHVEVAVGAHDDAVVGALGIVCLGFVVGHLHGRAAGSASVCIEAADGSLDGLGSLGDKGRFHQSLHGARVGDDGNAVVGTHGIYHGAQPGFNQFQPVITVHGAGSVDEENKVSGRDFILGEGFSLEAQANEKVLRSPGTGEGLGVDAQRFSACRFGVIKGKIVEVFFDAHRVDGNRRSVPDAAAHVGVGGAVGVYGEGGYRGFGHANKRIFLKFVKAVSGDQDVGLALGVGTGITHIARSVKFADIPEFVAGAGAKAGEKKE